MLRKSRLLVLVAVLSLLAMPATTSAEVFDSRTLQVRASVAPYAKFEWEQSTTDLSVTLGTDGMNWPSFTVTTNAPVQVQLRSVGFPNRLLNIYVRYQVFDRPEIPSIEPDPSGPTSTPPFQGGEEVTFTPIAPSRYRGWLNVRFLGAELLRDAWWELPSDTYEDTIMATILTLN